MNNENIVSWAMLESYKQCSEAWVGVVRALDLVLPGWDRNGHTPALAAVNSIHKLGNKGKQP